MSDQILVSRELLRNVKREVDDLRDERDALLERVAALEASGTATPDGDAQDLLERASERATQATEEATALRAELDDVRRQLAVVQAEAEACRAEADVLRRTHPMPPARAGASDAGFAERLAGASAPASPAAVAGHAFAAWCRRNRALVSRPYLFAAFLRSAAEGVEVEVAAVYRDRTAPRPTFRAEAIDGVEYWLVRIGPATLLLPQPLSAAQFRELAPAFTGAATPETVGEVVPATVRAEGSAHVLDVPGHVTTAEPA